MKPYEEVCFPSGILRWIREGDEYVCRLTEDQINEIKEIHEDPPKQLELPLVRVEEFVELIKGNEGIFGRPVMRTEWPTEEKPWVKTYSGGKPNYTQPIEPEPVAWGVDEGEGRCISLHDLYFVKEDADHMAELKGTHAKVVALYTAPPKKEWVELTKEECFELCVKHKDAPFSLLVAVQDKLKEKNA